RPPGDERRVVIAALGSGPLPRTMIAIFVSGGVALAVAVFGTPLLIKWLVSYGVGQHIREDGPAGHAVKAGTPTMGGIAMVVAADAGYLAGHIGTHSPFTRAGVLTVVTATAAGLVGFVDDLISVRRARSLGLNKRAKFGALLLISIGFGLAASHWAGVSTGLSFTRYDVPGVALGGVVFVIWAAVIIVGTANAVNLTDGLDGLASGASAFGFACLTLIAYWQLRHLSIYRVPFGLDLALASVAFGAACVGFLWWNASPAKIFMGDTGSLALGTGLACGAICMNLQLLLPIMGGLFVIETLSVVAQVISFRVFHTRVFRMAPVHHHYELSGWPETTVIVRFWIMSALCTALAMGLFYADFLSVRGGA
ncbi:MAG TPA: phospho-N-acetylmuramoyl-pentapeptide-transferase, partial [Acidimicrobiales bacterium]|nr:phospho-N-acetylmuramoyl-pentapeptide-transferase [Acidimicrobiales bacterium]